MKQRIYLDNASTSFPKAPDVAPAMSRFIEETGCNVNRGSYEDAYAAAGVVIETRERLARLFGCPKSRNVIFTGNVTTALNILIKGLLKPGDHLLVSSMEHNAVMRPLVQLEKQGVQFSRIPCDDRGVLQLDAVAGMIRPETRGILALHASNVCGTLLPVAELGKTAHAHGLFFVLDAAQTAGVFPLDMAAMHVDALAFTGHKSLLGPQGVGGFAVTDALAGRIAPLLSGGTGSASDSEEVPDILPDRFEPGTLNLPGIYGLHAALGYLEETGIDAIRHTEQRLAARLWEGLAACPGARMLGAEDPAMRAPIVSVDFAGRDNADIAFQLADRYHILTRCGLHCAPGAHKTLGTFPQGAVRFSPSRATTGEEIESCIRAVEELTTR